MEPNSDGDVRVAEGSCPPAAPASRIGSKLAPVPVLDGWRGLSILLVLACHMLPLGPKAWQVNSMIGPVGMSLFFTLSGFLMTATLLHPGTVASFFVRRVCRILPLAYLYILIVLIAVGASAGQFRAHLLFTANYEQQYLIPNLTEHLWSICIEVHFYAFIGMLAAVLGPRGLMGLPLLCVAITALRVAYGEKFSIVTHFRVDEILAGGCLALLYYRSPWPGALARVPMVVPAALLLVASHPDGGVMTYARPYCAAALVGTTVCGSGGVIRRILSGPVLRYVAAISYALYVVHPATTYGWLGTGGTATKYLLKRPISFLLSFGLAHASTYGYERHWIAWGKRRAHGHGAAPAGARPPGVERADQAV
jgi:peptidoglycan/LPS O-acetylase OafA/YrhL